ncbi:MFS multidrug transporter [Aspergillus sclerotioniger CBS 115572]|uniref:MFS multidrug transporter n=1 Tax=Aspergillus sclerotioniger CBS 115572 TaxID=1450535 RepID=A0A317WN22_9EURO|nr:MFS multidrug transporter [Aspergillus sclerotioniger CBS 115572]PWY87121.1 MFS multidrug transporter [Aspergillus sclerotioniger CBS 115572]
MPDLEEQHEKASTPLMTPGSSTTTVALLYPETDLSQDIKWTLLALISSFTFISPLASSMFSPAIGYVAAEFRVTNETLLSFSVTIFLLGYTFGPLLLAPLSEIYGRRIIFSSANWFFVVWQIGCALAPNLTSLIIFRLLAGVGGVGCVTLGAGVIADLFPVQQRGMATSIWALGPLIGPVVGPICGGFIGESIGWRWVFWILLIASGTIATAIEILNRETYAPVLIRWKTEKLAQELHRPDLRSAYDVARGTAVPTVSQVLIQGLRRPLILLIKSPIVLLLSTYMAVVYGLLYLFFTTITSVFEETYGFSTGLAGLAYLGIGIGFFIGLTLIALSSDRIVKNLTAKNNGVFQPEMRLPTMIFFSCLLPISFFWYGWSAKYHVQWIVPIIGMVPFGIGLIGIYMPIQTYVIDCYPAYAASANAALTALRSLLGALLPLAGPKLFSSLGLGWGNSLLGFIALAFVPVPIFFNRYGQRIRERWTVDLEGKKE